MTEPEGADRSLDEANEEEMKRATKDIRVGTGITFAVGFSLSFVAFALLSAT
jgi:hypothetical protein